MEVEKLNLKAQPIGNVYMTSYAHLRRYQQLKMTLNSDTKLKAQFNWSQDGLLSEMSTYYDIEPNKWITLNIDIVMSYTQLILLNQDSNMNKKTIVSCMGVGFISTPDTVLFSKPIGLDHIPSPLTSKKEIVEQAEMEILIDRTSKPTTPTTPNSTPKNRRKSINENIERVSAELNSIFKPKSDNQPKTSSPFKNPFKSRKYNLPAKSNPPVHDSRITGYLPKGCLLYTSDNNVIKTLKGFPGDILGVDPNGNICFMSLHDWKI